MARVRTTPAQSEKSSAVAAGLAGSPVGSSDPAGSHAGYPIPGDGFVLIPVRRGGGLFGHAKVDARDAHFAEWNWHADRDGYVRRSTKISHRTVHYYLHREILGLVAFDGRMADHVDHDTLNNTRANLRVCTNSQNQQNRRGAASHSSTGVRGVCKGKRGRFRAFVQGSYLGSFTTVDQAAAVAEAARRSLGFLGGEIRPEVC